MNEEGEVDKGPERLAAHINTKNQAKKSGSGTKHNSAKSGSAKGTEQKAKAKAVSPYDRAEQIGCNYVEELESMSRRQRILCAKAFGDTSAFSVTSYMSDDDVRDFTASVIRDKLNSEAKNGGESLNKRKSAAEDLASYAESMPLWEQKAFIQACGINTRGMSSYDIEMAARAAAYGWD